MKLSITTEYTIWCQRCAHWEQRQSKNRDTFAKSARKMGWCIRGGKTMCPDCIEELKQGREFEDIGYRHAPM